MKINRRILLKKIILKLNKVDDFSYIDEVYNIQTGFPEKRWVLMLPGAGCQWSKEHNGGCYMCGFSHTLKHNGNKDARQLENKIRLAFLLGSYLVNVNRNKPESLFIYNGGSYLNDKEIPKSVQIKIIQCVVEKYKSIKNILVESRPEFITPENISDIKFALNDNCKLSIGIGLECKSDYIRKNYINKGFKRRDYEKAVNLLKSEGIGVLTYIFLKPIMLTERQAIDEAIESIEYAFSCGTDSVALESAFIQKGTIMHQLYKEKKYKPPWLWSILTVVEKGAKYGPIHIGSFHDNPEPIKVPANCPQCNDKVMRAISHYNKYHDLSAFSLLNCLCKKQWDWEISI